MERTIDGIDYIAKSEVLRIIDEEYSSARSMQAFCPTGGKQHCAWGGYADAMQTLRRRIADPKER